jgi:hypothetical protein
MATASSSQFRDIANRAILSWGDDVRLANSAHFKAFVRNSRALAVMIASASQRVTAKFVAQTWDVYASADAQGFFEVQVPSFGA